VRSLCCLCFLALMLWYYLKQGTIVTTMTFKGIGIYHSGPGGIEQPGDFGYKRHGESWELARYCPKYGVCFIKIHQAPADQSTATWCWDGNVERPTISPSIGCDAAPRCGRHDVITAGELLP
jgi:hypothetical protein